MTPRVWFWLLSLAVLWGGSFFFAKVAVAELAPLTVVFGRVALAAVALNLVLHVTASTRLVAGRPWCSFFAMGALNNVLPFSLIFWAQTHIDSGLAAILNATTPLFTIAVAHLFTRDEKMKCHKAAAALVGLGGVAILIGPHAMSGLRTDVWGQVACLGAALSYAFAGIYGRRFKAMGIGALEVAAGQVSASTVLILPIMLFVDRPWALPSPPSATTWAALAALALLSTALAYVLYFRILAAAGATNLLLVTFLIPVVAVLLGGLLLDEHLGTRQAGGMLLIALALVLANGRSLRVGPAAK
jgi:drug/metabolite transporter (DMT)-like permease